MADMTLTQGPEKWMLELADELERAPVISSRFHTGLRRAYAKDLSAAAGVIRSTVTMRDKIEGLTTDLQMAVQVAWRRGAKDWARLNYPQWVEWLEACDRNEEARQ